MLEKLIWSDTDKMEQS